MAQRFPQPEPLHNLGAANLAFGRNGDLGQDQLRGAVLAGGVQGLLGYAGIVGGHQEHGGTGLGLGGHQVRVGLDAERHQDAVAGEHISRALGSRGDRTFARLALESDGQDLLARDSRCCPIVPHSFGAECGERSGS
ncbi:Uncharacterised protein [Mycobacteroides abscessus subsp. abscessus]|nr:Uncharacterised protein [Mycobacteroides abscessus subsp. abscessus]